MADNKKSDVTRRDFLSNVTVGAAALPGTAAVAEEPPKDAKEPDKAATTPAHIEYPRKFEGRHLARIAFPLGGIGAGSVSLGGRGQLRDWEIFNRPDKGNALTYSFPAIHTQMGKQKPVTRVLEARFLPPFEGPSGLSWENVPGLPRLESAVFTGEFPIARVDFHDSELPVHVSLEAFTPFVPLDADASGLPAAILRYKVKNPAAEPASVSIAFSIDNPVGKEGRTNEWRNGSGVSGLLMNNPFWSKSDPLAGTFALSILEAGDARVTYIRGWQHEKWPWTAAMLFWDDFSSDGALGPEPSPRTTVGSICLNREIAARGEAAYTFLLTWHFPNRTPERIGWEAVKGHEKAIIGNHYCTRFVDAWGAAEHVASELPALERRTREFVDAIRETTLPGAVKDSAISNLSTLVTPTSFRTSDGHFFGFEGCNDHAGCCFGTCSHVWNYEAATAFVFPALARSQRERMFGFRIADNGLMDMRELLPFGLERWGKAAADGQMGQIMHLYLDWTLGGDTEWLRKQWPGARKALEFAWIPAGWDENRDGVMEGAQHNTYDVEFYGPNPLCGVWYLGALRAGEEMARAVGDTTFADECRKLFLNGSQWIDGSLFNGEYYIQKVEGRPKEKIAEGLAAGMGTVDSEHPTYQAGDGCLVDQLAGQYFAYVTGLGLLLDPSHVRKTLESIYKYNYKRSLHDHEAVQRTFALNDEAGLVICDYGRGHRPRIPFPYYGELMTGFEYSAAILMLFHDMVPQGIELIEAIRRRYDGERRNPWNEAECGHHYARAMASWSAILALSGFHYSGVEGHLRLQPKLHQDAFRSIWTSGPAWGVFSQKMSARTLRADIKVVDGSLPLQSLKLAPPAGASLSKVSAALDARKIPAKAKKVGGGLIVTFAEKVQIGAGQRLEVTV